MSAAPRNVVYGLAGPQDEAELRALLRANPLAGRITVSFECEPDFFRAAAVEGPFHQTIVGREAASGRIVGMGSRAIRPVYLNGQAAEIGYMSQLRVDQRIDWGLALARLIAKAFAFYQTQHADGRTPFYLMSVIADNHPAVRFLTSGLPGMPRLYPYQRLVTYTIAPRGWPKPWAPAGLHLAPGRAEDAPEIAACLQRNGSRRQFCPVWTAETLFDPALTPGLRAEDFWLAWAGGRLVGCLARWDQSAVKQSVVCGYRGALGRWRRVVNLAGPLLGIPYLPPPGTRLRFSFASHLAVDDDQPQVFAALLRAVYGSAAAAGDHYFMLGLSKTNPLTAVLRRSYRYIAYVGQLYLVAWSDGQAAAAQVDGRPAGPEIGVM
jgi:hypothetical protein